MKLVTRMKIVGIEVMGLGAFLLLELGLSLRQPGVGGLAQGFGWDLVFIGGLMILVGFELLSLVKHLPHTNTSKEMDAGPGMGNS